MRVYIDESGDLGFSKKASSYFIIAALIAYDHLAIQRCFARIRRNKLKKRYRELPELKFNNSSVVIKRRILSCIASSDVAIAYSVLRKEQVYPHLRDKHQIIYNFLTGSIIAHIIQRFPIDGEVRITVDRTLSGIQREAFDQYIIHKTFERNISDTLSTIPIVIEHIDSKREPCIQAADFIAGALHHYYREGDDTMYRLIKNRIKIEFDYFEGPKN